MKYPFRGLSKHQRRILDEIGCGNYSLAAVFPSENALVDLLKRKMIEPCGEKIICQSRFGTMRVTEYQMLSAVHYQWTIWQSSEYDKLPESEKEIGL